MNYPLERLGPDRFQELCQALLLRAFPMMQCYPVGIADGGRDALRRLSRQSFVIYQVKSTRHPDRLRDPVAWLRKALDGERSKIEDLARRGAQAYVLLTNVKGTPVPDVGSIDRVDAMLRQAPIQNVQCLWRDDIERRLDTNRDVRAAFPELLTAIDVLEMFLSRQSTDRSRSRSRALRAYMADQFDIDSRVRFRQAHLDNQLFELFIDVPIDARAVHRLSEDHKIRPSPSVDKPQSGHSEDDEGVSVLLDRLGTKFIDPGYYDDEPFPSPAKQQLVVGAADLLLDEEGSRRFQFAVLEGSPGQGKSTLGQYLCQVNRLKLLDRRELLLSLPPRHRSVAAKLPIKLELRDYAAWLRRESPFGRNVQIPAEWNPSLESFIAFDIALRSGGGSFDVSDLQAVIDQVSTLLVLDGLDEVADIEEREEVVREVSAGVVRLRELNADTQVLVTTRPSAFANSPGFSPRNFGFLTLTVLPEAQALDYAVRWTRARKLPAREATEIQQLLSRKLQQAHMRDLARNPMQLAILLALLLSHGVSLPDKRTELYDEYMRTFFAREAEKNPVVRDNRQLLIDIHRYLAWVMHTAAEQGASNGRMPADQLRQVLIDHLTREGHPTTIVDSLFHGVVERVCALVQRIEGLYEFEVQPLREYFCARYLYNTAQYSPPGASRSGSLPHRFEGIARNPYWLNVARFFAGCYSHGELASLADSLYELSEHPELGATDHPRLLTTMLVGDWVFAQAPRVADRVLTLLETGLGERHVLSSDGALPRTILPRDCGGHEVARVAWARARSFSSPQVDRRHGLVSLAARNLPPSEVRSLWEAVLETGESPDVWWDGLFAGVFGHLGTVSLQKLFLKYSSVPHARRAMAMAGRTHDVASDPLIADVLLNEVLSGGAWEDESASNSISRLSTMLETMVQPVVHRVGAADSAVTTAVSYLPPSDRIDSRNASEELARQLLDIIEPIVLARPGWHSDRNSFDEILGGCVPLTGERQVWRDIAVLSGGSAGPPSVRTKVHLSDPAVPLLDKAREAYTRARSVDWWRQELTSIEPQVAEFVIAMCLAYCPVSLLVSLREEINAIVTTPGFDLSHSQTIAGMARHLRGKGSVTRSRARQLDDPSIDEQFLTTVLFRLGPRLQISLMERVVGNEISDDYEMARLQTSVILKRIRLPRDWELHLDQLAAVYAMHGDTIARPRSHTSPLPRMPAPVVSQVLATPGVYPLTIIGLAELSARRRYRAQDVGTLSGDASWFAEFD